MTIGGRVDGRDSRRVSETPIQIEGDLGLLDTQGSERTIRQTVLGVKTTMSGRIVSDVGDGNDFR